MFDGGLTASNLSESALKQADTSQVSACFTFSAARVTHAGLDTAPGNCGMQSRRTNAGVCG